jgi:cold shock CspA family protein
VGPVCADHMHPPRSPPFSICLFQVWFAWHCEPAARCPKGNGPVNQRAANFANRTFRRAHIVLFVMIGCGQLHLFLAQLPCWRAGAAFHFRCPHANIFCTNIKDGISTMSATRLTGCLIKWDIVRGYGFIKVLGEEKHYFLHNRLIRAEHRASVETGRCFSFVPATTKRGLEAWAPSLIHAPAIAGD